MDNSELERMVPILEELLAELRVILKDIEAAKEADTKTEIDGKTFFDTVRESLFGGKLTEGQVSGMQAKVNAFREASFPLSWAAYAMATSYHETARRMLPVREGLDVSDGYRRKHFRYYPWYGRGDVQLTWEDNYKKADAKLGLGGKLIANLDLALDPDISARILVQGMKEGWFSKDRAGKVHDLSRYLTEEEEDKAAFTQARRIINLMDKADMIAGYAIKFQSALKAAGYGKVS